MTTLGVHGVISQSIGGHGFERAGANFKLDPKRVELLQQLGGQMQTGRGRGHGSRTAVAKHCLVPISVRGVRKRLGPVLPRLADVRRQRRGPTRGQQPFGRSRGFGTHPPPFIGGFFQHQVLAFEPIKLQPRRQSAPGFQEALPSPVDVLQKKAFHCPPAVVPFGVKPGGQNSCVVQDKRVIGMQDVRKVPHHSVLQGASIKRNHHQTSRIARARRLGGDARIGNHKIKFFGPQIGHVGVVFFAADFLGLAGISMATAGSSGSEASALKRSMSAPSRR